MKQQGFTLIELLTVMTVIGILAGLSIVSFQVYRKNAAYSVAEHTLRNAQAAVEASELGQEAELPTVPLTTHSGPGGINNGPSAAVLQGMMLPANVQLQVEYDPSCDNAGCQAEYLQVNHCRAEKFVRFIRFGDGTGLTLRRIPGASCE